MKYESLYKIAVVAIASGILVVQLLILSRMATKTPTLGDLQNAKGEQRREMLLGLPLVHVQGSVGVNNEPLQVQIVR